MKTKANATKLDNLDKLIWFMNGFVTCGLITAIWVWYLIKF